MLLQVECDMSVFNLQTPTVDEADRPDTFPVGAGMRSFGTVTFPETRILTVPKRPFHHPLPQFSSHCPQIWHALGIIRDGVIRQF